MTRRGLALFLLMLTAALAQGQPPKDFVCPMDPDIRSATPGVCSRCGMKLVPGIPDPAEYPVRLLTSPRVVKPGAPAELIFEILDPKTNQRVTKFEVVHEKLFHLFLVSDDLKFFAHEHPTPGADGLFRYTAVFPKAAAYRLLCDFYPAGGTPQLHARTFITAGYKPPAVLTVAQLETDVYPKTAENLEVGLEMIPVQPIAGQPALLFFTLSPADGLEQYLGAWGHMLAASADLIDTIHTHPFIADGGPRIQFNVTFPREGMYRLWVQFQRQGKVNTVQFTVPVTTLK